MKNDFQTLLEQKGRQLYRPMPWRDDTRPYYVLVSELMLQQTQVARVVPKFTAFVGRFPDVQTLASASLGEVLRQWQGLGYNRRAKYLHGAARMIVRDCGGQFPTSLTDLMKLPGVGKNTAGAIMAYAYNQPALFVETNVRTVYIHHFFADNFAVTDAQILEKLAATLDRDQPRQFYWHLMDYGAWLKLHGVRTNAQSRHYKKQSALRGSLREMRGEIVRRLAAGQDDDGFGDIIGDERFAAALDGLLRDGLVATTNGRIHLTK